MEAILNSIRDAKFGSTDTLKSNSKTTLSSDLVKDKLLRGGLQNIT